MGIICFLSIKQFVHISIKAQLFCPRTSSFHGTTTTFFTPLMRINSSSISDDILETIERERVTITSLVPAVATLCVELLELDSFAIFVYNPNFISFWDRFSLTFNYYFFFILQQCRHYKAFCRPVLILELDSFDISSVKTVIIGGARMEEKLAKNK